MRYTPFVAILASLTAFMATPHSAAAEESRVAAVLEAADARLRAQSDIWFKDGDFPKVVQLLRVRANSDKADYDTWTDLGWMLENIERKDEALALYVSYRRANPQDPDGAFPEANYYFKLKLYAKVPPLIEPTLDRGPHGNSWRILAHSYERMGLLTDSRRVWERYIGGHPEDETAKANLRRVIGKLTPP